MDKTLHIPETLDALTPEWLTKVLSENGHLSQAQVIDSRQKLLGEGEGFLGDIVRLSLTFDGPEGNAPQSVIAKMPKLANRTFGELLGAYERESCFYEQLADKVPLRIPQVYYSAFDRDRGSENQEAILAFADKLPAFMTPLTSAFGLWIAGKKNRRYILLMEDLSGIEPGDQLTGATLDQCRQVLSSIARAHRSFWGGNDLRDHFWLLPQTIDMRMRHRMSVDAIPSFAKRFPEPYEQTLKPYMNWAAENGLELAQKLVTSAPETLLHSDLRLDNIFFDPEDTEHFGVMVIDWQLVRRGAAAYDVAYFHSCALLQAVTPEEELGLLKHYYEALCQEGPIDYSFDAFHLDYQRSMVLVMQNLTNIDQTDSTNERGYQLFNKWMERLAARVKHIDVDNLL